MNHDDTTARSTSPSRRWRSRVVSLLAGIIAVSGASTIVADGAGAAITNVSEVSGSAYGASVDVTLLDFLLPIRVALAPTPEVTLPPSGGGPFQESVASVQAGNLLDAGLLEVRTKGATGANGFAESSAQVADVTVGTALTPILTADVIRSECRSTGAGSTGSTTIANLGVLNIDPSLAVNPGPNTQIVVPLVGTVTLNEQIRSNSANATSITVNAVHVELDGILGTGDIIISQSRCGVKGPATGFIRICKDADNANGTVTGNFNFSFAGRSVTVAAGRCSAAVALPAGEVTVVETARPGFEVTGCTARPGGRLVSCNPATRTVVATVVPGAASTRTTVRFTNRVDAPDTGFLEICKEADPAGPVSGVFTFTFAGFTTDVPVGACSPAFELPVGELSITESAEPGAVLTGCAAQPAARQVSCNLDTRTSVVRIESGDISNQTIAIFTNRAATQATGRLQVCKAADNGNGTVTGDFTFDFAGQSATVPVGGCSAEIAVPAGDVTVVERDRPAIRVTNCAAVPASALVSCDNAAKTAVVTVTEGNLTTVTFTNRLIVGTLKVCKVAGPGIDAGSSFDFTVSYTGFNAVVTVPEGTCVVVGGATDPAKIPVGTRVTVQETSVAGVVVSSITTNPTDRLVSANLGTRTGVVKIGNGVTEIIFTNRAT